jgi:dihydrofolate reductase
MSFRYIGGQSFGRSAYQLGAKGGSHETNHRFRDGDGGRLLSGPHGELDWFVRDEEIDRFANELLDSVDTILYGRATYQMMAGYWPQASGSFAEKTNRLPKLVFTSTLEETPWGEWDNASPVKGLLADEIARLKDEPGGDIVIYGSGSVVGHSMTALAIAGGSRPARSQPAAAAASGTPMIASVRYRNGTSLR